MTTARSKTGRRTGVFAALLALGLITMTGVGYADPGNGNGATNSSDKANGKGLVTAESSSTSSGTSGDTTQPQPASNADFTGNGANTSGAYDSTRNGSPSLNGNGGGNATGKPCAGCVGKADNKNPKGQAPNGSDHNNGYECDGNNGVGKTNPAHTGCQPSTPVNPPPVVTPPEEVLGEVISRSGPTPQVLGLTLGRPAALAFTGFDVAGLTLIALLMLAAGVVLTRISRREVAPLTT
jgi:hypothetical protein